MQRDIDELAAPVHSAHPSGSATIETYTVHHTRNGKSGIVIGRLAATDERFIAASRTRPTTNCSNLLQTADDPIGQQRARDCARPRQPRHDLRSPERRSSSPERRPGLRDDYEFVTVHRDGHLLEITINRPDVRNCLHPPAHEELDEIFDAYFADPDLWVAIITGAGDKAFCAGNDLVYSASGKPMYVPLNGFAGLTSRRGMHKPVIAAVNGFAMGGGFEIALACHLVVADESAQFALSEVKVGLIAGAGGLIRLPRAIPAKIATELILTGRRIGAETAHQLGVVNRVASHGQALATARELGGRDPRWISDIRAAFARTDGADCQGIADTVDAVTAPNDAVDELMTSADAIEGMTAFATKRAPEWKNR